jgi:hypothetical protein
MTLHISDLKNNIRLIGIGSLSNDLHGYRDF